MKPKTALLLLGLMMAPAAFAQSTTYDPATRLITYSMVNGWNLVPAPKAWGPMGDQTCNPAGGSNAFSAAYYFSPVQNQYLGGTVTKTSPPTIQYSPANAENLMNAENQSHYYHVFGGGQWIYASYPCTLSGSLLTDATGRISESAEEQYKYTVKKGWNLLVITPYMSGKTFRQAFHGCSVSKMNFWDAQTQKWTFNGESIPSSTLAQNFFAPGQTSTISEGLIGHVLAFKIADDCRLAPVNP